VIVSLTATGILPTLFLRRPPMVSLSATLMADDSAKQINSPSWTVAPFLNNCRINGTQPDNTANDSGDLPWASFSSMWEPAVKNKGIISLILLSGGWWEYEQ
jgi:hypothetical protein